MWALEIIFLVALVYFVFILLIVRRYLLCIDSSLDLGTS